MWWDPRFKDLNVSDQEARKCYPGNVRQDQMDELWKPDIRFDGIIDRVCVIGTSEFSLLSVVTFITAGISGFSVPNIPSIPSSNVLPQNSIYFVGLHEKMELLSISVMASSSSMQAWLVQTTSMHPGLVAEIWYDKFR